MRILLTNDDGIHAPGLAALAKEIKKIADVIIVAPATEMSAVGHAITLSDPLRVNEYFIDSKFFGYAVRGTPADCVKIAYWALLQDQPKPDLLISGINLGSNTGINTIYSGTVSAATEGAILKIPSIAISLTTFTKPDFSIAAEFARNLVPVVMRQTLPTGVYLNVNIPAVPQDQIRGVQITRQGMANYRERFHIQQDPRGQKFYWLTGEKETIEIDEDVDDRAILQNKITITPVHYDMTCYAFIPELKKWNIQLKV